MHTGACRKNGIDHDASGTGLCATQANLSDDAQRIAKRELRRVAPPAPMQLCWRELCKMAVCAGEVPSAILATTILTMGHAFVLASQALEEFAAPTSRVQQQGA